MTKTADELSEKIAAARALPEATGMQIIAERFVRMRPSRTLAEIQEKLRSVRNDPYAYDDPRQRFGAILAAPVAGAHSKPDQRPEASHAVKPVAASIYTVTEATETKFLCRIAQAPELAAGFIAARRPLSEVRATLTQRGYAASAAKYAAIGRKAAIASMWDEIVSDVNAQNARSGLPT